MNGSGGVLLPQTREALDAHMAGLTSMAGKISMDKGINPRDWDYVLMVDKSGSMLPSYQNRSVQAAIARVMAVARLSGRQQITVIFFGGRGETAVQVVTIDIDNLLRVIGQGPGQVWAAGGTPMTEAYMQLLTLTGNGDLLLLQDGVEPTVRRMSRRVQAVCLCDGGPNHRPSMVKIMQLSSYRGIQHKFFFFGNDEKGRQFLVDLDDNIPVGVPFVKGGRLIDNADMKPFADLATVPDNVFFTAMFDECKPWVSDARRYGMF